MKAFILRLLKSALGVFWRLHRPLTSANVRFKNRHAGETCLIFANGGSLKYYDVSKFPKLPAIACTYSLIDNRMRSVDLKYVASTDSYLFYPLLYNTYPFVRRFQKNMVRKIFRKIMADNPQVQFFVNLTNYYSPLCRAGNVNYFHHFGDKTSGSCDLAGKFAVCQGALDVMLGMAKYLGFSKAVLVGCDYLGSPPMMGHFYADSRTFTGAYLSEYCERVKAVADRLGIEVLAILPKGVSCPVFEYSSYEDYFGIQAKYTENTEFIDVQYLEWLRDAASVNQAIMNADQEAA